VRGRWGENNPVGNLWHRVWIVEDAGHWTTPSSCRGVSQPVQASLSKLDQKRPSRRPAPLAFCLFRRFDLDSRRFTTLAVSVAEIVYGFRRMGRENRGLVTLPIGSHGAARESPESIASLPAATT
jgi:hypothetical protein